MNDRTVSSAAEDMVGAAMEQSALIAEQLFRETEFWASAELPKLALAIKQNLVVNWLLWLAEDAVREAVSDGQVVAEKRRIDKLNALRHGTIEAIDGELLRYLDSRVAPLDFAPALRTETFGQATDRLNVLVLRRDRLRSLVFRANAEDAMKLAAMRDVCEAQFDILREALTDLLSGLMSGTVRQVEMPALKLYNDPKLRK